MNYWVISDTHFGHDKMEVYCNRPKGFEYIILKNIQQCWSTGDIIIHLGDICIGNDSVWIHKLIPFDSRILRFWLTRGNHDRKSNCWYLTNGFDFIAESFTINIYGKKILLSHFPQPDSGYDINIHGHFHNSDHRKHEPKLVAIKNNKQFLVAMEYNSYMPYNLENIVEKFDKGKRQ